MRRARHGLSLNLTVLMIDNIGKGGVTSIAKVGVACLDTAGLCYYLINFLREAPISYCFISILLY